MINYFIYTIISLGFCYGIYYWLLRNQKTFQFNRFFLLFSMLLCFSAPFIELDMFKSMPSITEIPIVVSDDSIAVSDKIDNAAISNIEFEETSQTSLFLVFYLLVSGIFVFRFLLNLFRIYRLTNTGYESYGKLKLVKSNDSEMISSFFNYVFISDKSILKNEDYKTIIAHEFIHFKEKHTIDIILSELIICGFWFNPFIWFYKKAIIQNHEYIADEMLVSSGINIENYSNTIISLGQKEYRVPLTSGFNFTQIKNRIIMLHKSKSSVLKRSLKVTSVVILLASVFVLSSYRNLEKPLVVIIDAGHGGKDNGQIASNVKEKDIVLNISNYLKQLSDDHVKIITTRDTDYFKSIGERITFINNQNPDLVISLHSNANKDSNVSGIETYYFESENKSRLKKSRNFSSALTVSLIKDVFEKAKINSSKFKILKEVKSPAVLLELGFLTNNEDFSKITQKENQQEIAQAIYDGVLKGSKIK